MVQRQLEQFALQCQLARQTVLQLVEPFLVRFELGTPGIGVNLDEGVELGAA